MPFPLGQRFDQKRWDMQYHFEVSLLDLFIAQSTQIGKNLKGPL
jgi:hypothetical protein